MALIFGNYWIFLSCASSFSLARQWTMEDEEEVERERRRREKSSSTPDQDGDSSPTPRTPPTSGSTSGPESSTETSQGLSRLTWHCFIHVYIYIYIWAAQKRKNIYIWRGLIPFPILGLIYYMQWLGYLKFAFLDCYLYTCKIHKHTCNVWKASKHTSNLVSGAQAVFKEREMTKQPFVIETWPDTEPTDLFNALSRSCPIIKVCVMFFLSVEQIQLDFVEMLRTRDEKRRMRQVEALRRQKEEEEGDSKEGRGEGEEDARVVLLGELDEEKGNVYKPQPPTKTSSYSPTSSGNSSTRTNGTKTQVSRNTSCFKLNQIGRLSCELVSVSAPSFTIWGNNVNLWASFLWVCVW